MKNSIVIRFEMTKGEGEYPAESEFTADEIAEIRKTATFYLDYYPENADEDLSDLKIESCKVHYDGITYSPELDCGLHFKEGELSGSPCPIIEFVLSRPVDAESFRKSVWMSSYSINPSSRAENDAEPFSFEDQNGYTSVIDESDFKELIESYQSENLISGKVFSAEQLLDGISCLEMI